MTSFQKADQLKWTRKKRPTKAELAEQYALARERARRGFGYGCEYCGAFIPEGLEHAHHVLWGRLHGTRDQLTTADMLAIVGGDFSPCKCHLKLHKLGIKSWADYPHKPAFLH